MKKHCELCPGLTKRAWSHTQFSSEGMVVWDNDPQLQHPTTNWLMHLFLSFSGNGFRCPPPTPSEWGGWTYFVYGFLPGRERFSIDDLVSDSLWFFSEPNWELLRTNFRYVLRAYTEKHALGALGWLHLIERNHFAVGPANHPNLYFFAYALAKFWERDFNDLKIVAEADIFRQPLGLRQVLRMGAQTFVERLSRLETLGVVSLQQNKSGIMVVRNWEDPLEFLRLAYSEGG